MVHDRADYDFVEVAEEISVTGDIMPVRAGEYRRRLRGEDGAFICEASWERTVATGGAGPAEKEVYDGRIVGAPWQSALSRLRAVSNSAVDMDYDGFADMRLTEEQFYQSDLLDLFPGARVDTSAIACVQDGFSDQFATGKYVRLQPIWETFDGLSRLRRFRSVVSWTRDSDSCTEEDYHNPEWTSPPYHLRATGFALFATGFYKEHGGSAQCSSTSIANGGRLSFAIGGGYAGDRAVAMLPILRYNTTLVGGQSSTWEYRYGIMRVDLTRGAGGAYGADLSAIASRARSLMRGWYGDYPSFASVRVGTGLNDYGYATATVSMLGVVPVVFGLGDHTEFDMPD